MYIYITTPNKNINDKNTDNVKSFTRLQAFTRFCMSPYQNQA